MWSTGRPGRGGEPRAPGSQPRKLQLTVSRLCTPPHAVPFPMNFASVRAVLLNPDADPLGRPIQAFPKPGAWWIGPRQVLTWKGQVWGRSCFGEDRFWGDHGLGEACSFEIDVFESTWNGRPARDGWSGSNGLGKTGL